MNNPSIYDFRNGEIETARQIRRERRREIVEAVVGVPLLVAYAVFMILACGVA